jgi:adenylate cyclase
MDAPSSTDIFLFEGFRLDRRGGVLYRRNEHGAFTPMVIGSRALDILGVLIDRPGDLVSRAEIMDAVWPGTVVEDSNINVQVAALRRILDDERAESSCIRTVSGRGYRFVGPVTQVEPAALQSGNGSGGAIAETEQPHDPSTGPLAHIAVAPRLSIVVLPFTNLSDDREQQYFADGITEDLTTDLSRIAGMLVISRNTAFTYRNKPVDTKQIGRELGVRYALEGSIRRSGSQVRVNAQLIDAETDTHLWAERFDGDTGDLFTLQDEVTSRIAIALNFAMVSAEAARPTANPDALDYIFRGRAAANNPPTRHSYAERISLFERALALDPGSIEAQSYLALNLTGRMLGGVTVSAAADIARAEGLAGQALAGSPRSPLAHYARGEVLRAQRREAEAILEYETVLALNRNWPGALFALGNCKLFTGSIEETIPLEEKAIRLSPRDPGIGVWYLQIGRVHLIQSRTDGAIVWLEKARTANAAHPLIRAHLAAAYGLNGQSELAHRRTG